MIVKAFLLVSVLSLSACSAFSRAEPVVQAPPEPEVVVRTVEVKRPAPIVPRTDVLVTRDVQWVVLSKETASQRLEDGKSYFALDAQNYQNLSQNIASTRTVIQQKDAVIRTYERYFER